MEAKIMKTRWGTEVRLTKTWVPNETGELAIRFATHFGIVAAKTEGQDQAGRAKLELQTVDEIVDRSCELAEKLVARLEEKKWIVLLPDEPEEEPLVPADEVKKAEDLGSAGTGAPPQGGA